MSDAATPTPGMTPAKASRRRARKPRPPKVHTRRWSQIPPEGVPIGFNIATLGSRFGAQFLDILFTYGGALLLLLAVIYAGHLTWLALVAFYSLTILFIRVPYYVLSELIWNGRTLGKLITGIRVISLDGRRLTAHQIVARNLMKEVELFSAHRLHLWRRKIVLGRNRDHAALVRRGAAGAVPEPAPATAGRHAGRYHRRRHAARRAVAGPVAGGNPARL